MDFFFFNKTYLRNDFNRSEIFKIVNIVLHSKFKYIVYFESISIQVYI